MDSGATAAARAPRCTAGRGLPRLWCDVRRVAILPVVRSRGPTRQSLMIADGELASPTSIRRGVWIVRIVCAALTVVCVAGLVFIRVRQAERSESVEDLGASAQAQITRIHADLAAALEGATADASRLAAVRDRLATAQSAVGRLRVPRPDPHLEDSISAITDAFSAESMFLVGLDDLLATTLVDVDADDVRSVRTKWAAADAAWASLAKRLGTRRGPTAPLTVPLATFLKRYEGLADVARADAEASSERDSELSSLQSFYESVLDLMAQYAAAR